MAVYLKKLIINGVKVDPTTVERIWITTDEHTTFTHVSNVDVWIEGGNNINYTLEWDNNAKHTPKSDIIYALRCVGLKAVPREKYGKFDNRCIYDITTLD